MARSRAAALAGARRVISERGVRKATMGDVAIRGGLAKATLYNHFRTKDALVSALLVAEVDDLRDHALQALGAGAALPDVLARVASDLAEHPVLAGVRAVEPEALLGLVGPTSGEPGDAAREAVGRVLDAADRAYGTAQVDLVLRWLRSFLVDPGQDRSRADEAAALALALPVAPRTTSFAATAR